VANKAVEGRKRPAGGSTVQTPRHPGLASEVGAPEGAVVPVRAVHADQISGIVQVGVAVVVCPEGVRGGPGIGRYFRCQVLGSRYQNRFTVGRFTQAARFLRRIRFQVLAR